MTISWHEPQNAAERLKAQRDELEKIRLERADLQRRMQELKTTVRNIPLVDEYDGPGKCIVTGETVAQRAVIAKAY